MHLFMQVGPHQLSCLMEIACHVPGSIKGMRLGSRQALPLVLRRVRRTASSVLVPESIEVVSECLEDLSLELLDTTVLVCLVTVVVCVALLRTKRAR